MEKLRTSYQNILLGFLWLFFQSCSNDWPTKEQVLDLKGEWQLVSIVATDKVTFQDTTWSAKGGFIRFAYHGKSGATPITYALAQNQVIDGYYSVPSENNLLLMPKDPISGYEKSAVGLPVSQQNPFELLGNELTLTGDCVVRNGDKSLTSEKKMGLVAVFRR